MEIDEIKGYWKEEDKRIIENVKINRDASFQKLRSSFDKIRIRRLLWLVQMCISVPLVFALMVFPRIKNDGSVLFYIALAGFIVPIVLSFIYYIYYYICLLGIDFTVSILNAQKEIHRLQMSDKKLNLLGIIIVPIEAVSIFKIFDLPIKHEAIIMLLLIAIIMTMSVIIKLKVLIPKEYSKVKSCLDEMEENEK
ncbi:MAG: hypothetical protein LUH15_16610 [Tannerellaceae bacterium]|nr:hypothetical protein [Tannerellaceae bacterium]